MLQIPAFTCFSDQEGCFRSLATRFPILIIASQSSSGHSITSAFPQKQTGTSSPIADPHNGELPVPFAAVAALVHLAFFALVAAFHASFASSLRSSRRNALDACRFCFLPGPHQTNCRARGAFEGNLGMILFHIPKFFKRWAGQPSPSRQASSSSSSSSSPALWRLCVA